MKRTEKETFVDSLRERIARAPVVYFTDYSGLDVKSMTKLRRTLRENGAEYVVVKNRLARRAFEESTLPDISSILEGPTGVVFGYEDAVGAAKALSEFAKAHDSKPAFKIGILDEKIIQPEQIDRIAKLPPKEQLLAELAGALEAPMAQLAAVLGAKLQEMAGLLDALKGEREGAGG